MIGLRQIAMFLLVALAYLALAVGCVSWCMEWATCRPAFAVMFACLFLSAPLYQSPKPPGATE